MYSQPHDLHEVITLLGERGGMLLGGGTDLIPRLLDSFQDLEEIIDLSRVEELKGIKKEKGFTIGAMVTHEEILKDRDIDVTYPFLVEAARSIGSPQIRARGTVGGNLANASPAADLPPVFMALEARLEIHGKDGRRLMPVEDLFLGPKKNSLARDEILTHIHLKEPEEGDLMFFYKLGKRKALSISIINLAILLRLSPKKEIQKLRVVLGAVGPTPLRIYRLEEEEGEILTPHCIERIRQLLEEEIEPMDDFRSSARYRRLVAGEIVKKYLHQIRRKNPKLCSI